MADLSLEEARTEDLELENAIKVSSKKPSRLKNKTKKKVLVRQNLITSLGREAPL